MLTVEGRDVYIARGKGRSDTVNVCAANNQRGEYDWIIRIFKPTNVTEQEVSKFSRIEDLVQWLRTERQGSIEEQPGIETARGCDAVVPRLASQFDPACDVWTQEAKWLLEHTLDQLVHEFIEFPYLHRVEHSLHARLFSMLSGQPHFARLFPLADRRVLTQTVHKEWPETVAREGRKRGNFDIAILAPTQLALSSVDDFRDGRIAAPIVLEMGLDYDAAHLAADEEKLINSAVHYPYLAHFLRNCYPDERIDRILLEPSGNIRSVYVRILRNETFYKLLTDTEFQMKSSV